MDAQAAALVFAVVVAAISDVLRATVTSTADAATKPPCSPRHDITAAALARPPQDFVPANGLFAAAVPRQQAQSSSAVPFAL